MSITSLSRRVDQMRASDSVWARSLWNVGLAAAAIGLMASSAAAQTTVNLIAAPVTKTVTLPNGNTVSVPMWGYALDGNCPPPSTATNCYDGVVNYGEVVTVPGPRISVPPGDSQLTVKLTNRLPEATSLVIPGQPFVAAPVRVGARVRSMTPEANPNGGVATYQFTGLKPGTFLYQSGSHSAVQVQMGLYGAMTKDAVAAVAGVPAIPAVPPVLDTDGITVITPGKAEVPAVPAVPGQAYAGAEYVNEAVLVYSEIDQALHEAVNAGTYGQPGGLTSTINYRPSLFLINGESYTHESLATIASGNAGEVTLLRLLNAGLRTHAPVLDNASLRIVAEDGNVLPFAKDQAALMLAAGKTHDALWTPAVGGVYSLYDRMLGLNAPGQGSAGMLAKLRIEGTPPPPPPDGSEGPPVANPDAFNGVESGPAVAGSVVGNDLGAPLTTDLVAYPHAGTLTLLASGDFTYTPNLHFFGVDEFTYRAVNGAGVSEPALVTITIAGVANAPVANSQTIGVDKGGNVSVTLSATDADGDPLKYYLTSLPTHGALSYINPLTKIETPILSTDPNRFSKVIPGGLVIYTPSAAFVGSDPFDFRAFDGSLYSPSATVTPTVYAAVTAANDLTQTVNLAVNGNDGSMISSYRWTLEEDLTYKVVPGVPDPNTLAVSFHKSYMPVVASGNQSQMPKVNPAKRYFVSVLPTENTYSNSGAEIETSAVRLGNPVVITCSKLPLPTARIRVRVFHDNSPLDGMWSADEPGLPGFQVTIDDAGGTYGMSGGHQSTDAFGNKIGTQYQKCLDVNVPPLNDFPGPGDIDANGNGVFDSPLTIKCDGYSVAELGNGFVLTDADGYAVIDNLVMGKYTVKVRAPGGQKWIQTTTIEGQPGIDAWVKPNEPQFFTEFGPPGPHVEVGFVMADGSENHLAGLSGPYTTIKGRVTNLRQSRPPEVAQFSGAPFNHTRAWVALNSGATGGDLLYTHPTNEDGTFEIAHVPAGSYQLMVFDSALDLIIGSVVVNVAGPATPATTDLHDVAVFPWFTNLYSYVFDDVNGDGIHQADEPGIPDQALNIRFRDGSIYQSLSTDDRGFKAFNETFPFFAWMIAEVDYTRFHSTGLTVVVDGGGDIPKTDWRGLDGIKLPPDVQKDLPAEAINPQPQPDNGGAMFRTESGAGTPFLLLEGFQGFIGQSTLMMWGKAPYDPPASKGLDVNYAPFDTFDPSVASSVPCPSSLTSAQKAAYCIGAYLHDVNADHNVDGDGNAIFDADHYNGGIAGIVHYGITRAENDPRWAVAENWDPGIADVTVQLWDTSRTHLLNEGTTDNFNREGLEPTGCQWPNGPYVYQGRTTDCFDGLRNFNQARPAAFDGGYAFSTVLADSYDPTHPDAPLTFNLPLAQRKATVPIPANKYVVKVLVPPGYQLQKEEDKNVDFGDTYIPQQFMLTGYPLADGAATALTSIAPNSTCPPSTPNCHDVSSAATTITLAKDGGKSIHPNDQITIDAETMRVTTVVGDVIGVLRGQGDRVPAPHAAGTDVMDFGAQLAPTVTDNALIAPFCVGKLHQVPEEFSLFPGDPAPFAGEMRPLCDAKLVTLRDGQQAAPDFHFFTEAPVAGHIYGMVLDDTTNEFDPNAPTFGEKYAPPFIGVAIRDWQGREITRTYTDQYGMYNALVPTTYTINPPEPSGVSPSILSACINPPTMPGPGGTVVPDPHFQKQYSHFCYPLQYLPGKTTYLDTPVVPTGAFTGNGTFPVDTEFLDGTPVIASVTGPEITAPGPYIVDRADSASRTITITSAGTMQVPNPAFDGTGGTALSPQPKLIPRDYGFGNAPGSVTVGGTLLTISSWTSASITAIVPTGVRTGQLQVVRGAGASARKSTLGVTLSVATSDMHTARPPSVVPSAKYRTIQAAIDDVTTKAGDLILVKPGVYEEMVVMTKPVRLQGFGALSTTINVVTTPAENIQAWLDRMGDLLLTSPPAGTLRSYVLPNQPAMTPAPFQPGDVAAVVGDEGPGVMVMSRNELSAGIGGTPLINAGTLLLGPAGTCLTTRLLTPLNFGAPANEAYCLQNENYTGITSTTANAAWRPNARIDGFSLIGASNAPGVLVNGYARYLEVSNNKIFTNSGTYAGGIQVGHAGAAAPFNDENAHNERVTIHNNMVTQNASNETGGGGGIVLGTGADNYAVRSNFVAGNLSSGHGGGIAHLGLSAGGVIDGNTVIFNESFIQATGTNGGGLFVGGTPGAAGAPTPGSGSVDVTNNLVQGNAASGGDGGGIALQDFTSRDQVRLYNNMIANNVAGLAGGGISIAGVPAGGSTDPLIALDIVHNTVVNNDSTGTAGGAFTAGPLTSVQQPAGIAGRSVSVPRVRIANSVVWQNRTFYYGACTPVGTPCGNPLVPVGPGAVTQYGEKNDPAHPYWDLGVFGGGNFAPQSSMLSAASQTNAGGTSYGGSENTAGTPPAFVRSYVNGSRQAAYQVGETTGEATLISVPAALDEGGNFIRPQFGPLSLENPSTNQLFGDYHVTAGTIGSPLGALFVTPVPVPGVLLVDFDGDERPTGEPHRGADQAAATAAPSIVITAPTEGATVVGSVTASATVSGIAGVLRVQVLVGTTVVVNDSSSPYSGTWNTTSGAGATPNGPAVLTARACSNAGTATDPCTQVGPTSAPVNVTVNNPGPVITAPANGATVSGSITVSATVVGVTGATRVQFFVGTTLVVDDSTSPYSGTWNTASTANGAATITAHACSNNTGTCIQVGPTSAPVNVTVNNPGPVITAPTNGATVSGSVPLSVTVVGVSGVTRVQYLVGTTIVADNQNSPYGGTWITTSGVGLTPNGPAVITARACSNNTGTCTQAGPTSAPVNVTVNNAPTGAASFSPNPVAFGNVANNSTTTQTVTVTNSGAAQLNITAAGVSGSGGGIGGWSFTKGTGTDNCTGATLAIGGTCTIGVTFHQSNSDAPRSGSLAITDNGTGAHSVALSGN